MKEQSASVEIKELEVKKEEIEKKINSLKIKLNDEYSNQEWIKIPGTEYEVMKNVIYKGKSYNEIMQLKKSEEELLTLKLIGIICEDKLLMQLLKMDGSSMKDDFFYKQPFPQNEKKGYVARFLADSGYSGLDSGNDPDYSDSYLGVRFVRKILKVKK